MCHGARNPENLSGAAGGTGGIASAPAIVGVTSKPEQAAVAGLLLDDIVGVPRTGTSVNPARSRGPVPGGASRGPGYRTARSAQTDLLQQSFGLLQGRGR